jgi:hypothetical protein
VYSIGVYNILKQTVSKSSLFFIPGALLFVANPYFLDFFSVSRGYGIASSLCVLSVSFLIDAFKNNQNKMIWLAILTASLASYASFTLLVLWVSIMILSAFFLVLKYKRDKWKILKAIGVVGIFGVGYLALIISPILKMQSTDQFVYWTSKGFYTDTVYSLVTLTLRGTRVFTFSEVLSPIIVLSVFVFAGYAVWRTLKRKSFSSPVLIVSLLILLTAGVNIVQTWVLGTPNLNGRTALFFFPLYIVLLMSIAGEIGCYLKSWVRWTVMILTVFSCVQHMTTVIDLSRTREWWYDAHTYKVLSHLMLEGQGEKISLGTDWRFNPSFHYHTKIGEYSNVTLQSYTKELHPEMEFDYYVIFVQDVGQFQDGYSIEQQYDDVILLKLKQ